MQFHVCSCEDLEGMYEQEDITKVQDEHEHEETFQNSIGKAHVIRVGTAARAHKLLVP